MRLYYGTRTTYGSSACSPDTWHAFRSTQVSYYEYLYQCINTILLYDIAVSVVVRLPCTTEWLYEYSSMMLTVPRRQIILALPRTAQVKCTTTFANRRAASGFSLREVVHTERDYEGAGSSWWPDSGNCMRCRRAGEQRHFPTDEKK